ncbi:hypothetical protein IG631_21219 [Alternaria alternata]|nr:hypothetical protein IG631_21219 [Alternaria alternata]
MVPMDEALRRFDAYSTIGCYCVHGHRESCDHHVFCWADFSILADQGVGSAKIFWRRGTVVCDLSWSHSSSGSAARRSISRGVRGREICCIIRYISDDDCVGDDDVGRRCRI